MDTCFFVLYCELLYRLAGWMDIEQDYTYTRRITIEYDFNRAYRNKGIFTGHVFDTGSVHCLLSVSRMADVFHCRTLGGD